MHVDLERSGLGCRRRRLAGDACALGRAARSPGTVAAGASVAVRRGRRRGPAPCGGRAGTARPALHDLEVTLLDDGDSALDTWARRIGLRSVDARHHARRARHAVHVRRQRPAALRQGRQLDPRRPPAHPGHPRPARAPHRPGRRRRTEPAAGLGRRHLRERGLLRAVRRARPDGLAGLPARLRRLPRGGAAPQRARGRGPRAGDPAGCRTRRWCSGTAATRTSGATSTGAGRSSSSGRTWGWATTPRCSRGWSPSSTPPAPTPPGCPARPVTPSTDVHPNDPDHGTHHEWEVWNRVDYTAYRDAVPRFCSEFGFQGPPTWATLSARSATPTARSRPRTTRPSCCTRRPTTATPSSTAASRRTSACPTTSPTGTGPPSSTRPGRWPYALDPLPVVVAPDGRRDRLAAQRLLAGDLVGRGRRRRAGKPLWWALRRLRRPAAHRAARGRAAAEVRRGRQRHRRAVGRERSCVRRERLDGTAARLGCRATSPSRPGRCTSRRWRADVAVPGDAASEVLVVDLGGERTVHTWVEDVDLDLDPAPLDVVGGRRSRVATGSTSRRARLARGRHPPRRPARPGCRRRRRARDPAGGRLHHLPRADRRRRGRGSTRGAAGAALRQRRGGAAGVGSTVGSVTSPSPGEPKTYQRPRFHHALNVLTTGSPEPASSRGPTC